MNEISADKCEIVTYWCNRRCRMKCTNRWIVHRNWNKVGNWYRCQPRHWVTYKTFLFRDWERVNWTTSKYQKDSWRKTTMIWSMQNWGTRSETTPGSDDFPWLDWNGLIFIELCNILMIYQRVGSCRLNYWDDRQSKVGYCAQEFCLECQSTRQCLWINWLLIEI